MRSTIFLLELLARALVGAPGLIHLFLASAALEFALLLWRSPMQLARGDYFGDASP